MRPRFVCFCALVLVSLGCSTEVASGYSSGLDPDRPIASLDAAEMNAFCVGLFSWAESLLGPDYDLRIELEPVASRSCRCGHPRRRASARASRRPATRRASTTRSPPCGWSPPPTRRAFACSGSAAA